MKSIAFFDTEIEPKTGKILDIGSEHLNKYYGNTDIKNKRKCYYNYQY